MANVINNVQTKKNHRLGRDLRKVQAGILDTDVYRKLNPSRGGYANWTAFDAGKRWADKGYTLDELTSLYVDYKNLTQSNSNEVEYYSFLEKTIDKLNEIIDFNIEFPLREKPNQLLEKIMIKLQSVVDFTIDNPTEEQIRISKFIDGYNHFIRESEAAFDAGYMNAQTGTDWENIPIESKENRFFKIGFSTYFTEIGFDRALLGFDLDSLPVEFLNNPFFMDGYNNGLMEMLLNNVPHNKKGR